MKYLNVISGFLTVFFICNGAFAANPIISAYNDTMYFEMAPEYAGAGQLTAISDTYFVYNLEILELSISHTEWLGDGSGGMYEAPYSPVTFNYNDVTLKDIATDPYLMLLYEGSASVLPTLQKQATEYFSQILKENYIYFTSTKARNTFYSNINQIDSRFFEPHHTDLNIWGAESYNWFKQSGVSDFNSSAFELHVGMDKYVNDNLLLGFSYAFSDGETTDKNDDTQNDLSHNVHLYAMYNFDNTYLNFLANYGLTNYTGNNDFNVSSYGAALNFGSKMLYNIIAETGLRYLSVRPDSYKDTLGNEINLDTNNFLTWTTGVKYGFDIKPVSIKAKLNLMYDIVHNDDKITVYYNMHDVYGTASFENWKPFGIEAGISAGIDFDNGISLSAEYLLNARKDFYSHTGMLRANYQF